MLDEPLGALDRSLRRSLLDELTEIFDRISTPVIYVTHDHEEALAVGDRVALMRSGRIEAVATPAELWRNPPSEFVARFLGFTNILDADIVDGHAVTRVGSFPLTADAPAGQAKVLLRADAFEPDASGSLVGKVHSLTFRGDHTLLRVDVPTEGHGSFRLEVEWRTTAVPAVGDEVAFATDTAGVVLLPLT
jgi:thiamine transport system ATP-binding protein